VNEGGGWQEKRAEEEQKHQEVRRTEKGKDLASFAVHLLEIENPDQRLVQVLLPAENDSKKHVCRI